MPHYAIHHSTPLSHTQTSALATTITALHTTLFSTPSTLVNVTFHPTTPASQTTYVGSLQVQTNYIHAFLRPRGPQNATKLKKLVEEISRVWEDIVVTPSSTPKEDTILPLNLQRKSRAADMNDDVTRMRGSLENHMTLHNIFIHESIVAGAEQGFALPLAGKEGAWMEENMAEFKRRMERGDRSMRALVGEFRVRSKL
ncbi:hypothetical protein J1614_000981 [Plenodomus biglobosus]|nr:hypothetical protein J1614_000981 [Plenodomus biglobosus]